MREFTAPYYIESFPAESLQRDDTSVKNASAGLGCLRSEIIDRFCHGGRCLLIMNEENQRSYYIELGFGNI